jgi:hypothetical protein
VNEGNWLFVNVGIVAETVKTCYQFSSVINHVGLSPNIDIYIFSFLDIFCTHKHSIILCSNTSIILLYVSKYISAPLAGLEMRETQIFPIFIFFFPDILI